MFNKIRFMFRAIDGTDRKRLVRLTLLSLLSPVIDVFSISMLLPILREMASEGTDERTFVKVLGIGCLLLFKTGYDLLMARTENAFRYDSTHKLTLLMYDLQQREELPEHKKYTQSQNLTRIRRDTSASVGMLLYAKALMLDILTMLGFACVLVWSAKLIGMISFAAVLVILVLLYFVNRHRVGSYGEKVRELEIRVYEMIYNAFGAYKEVKVDARREELKKQYEQADNDLIAEEKRYAMFSQIVSVITSDILQAAVYFVLAIMLAMNVDIAAHLSAVIVFVTVLVKLLPLSSSVLHSLIGIRYANAQYDKFHGAMQNYRALLEKAENEASIRVRKATLQEGIRVRNLTFSYEDNDTPIFENAEIDIPKGTTVAITGSSGIGKSTFLDLIIGLLMPQSGEIYYDDVDIVSGRDAEGPCRIDVGDIISYIPQEVYLNGYSVRDNVTFMTPSSEIDEQRVCECLKIAAVYDDVMKMPQGLDTLIGNNGTKLSGGQRQRIALARALYKNFELLVLDEATASLDMETEAAILDSLRERQPGKTILMVTHHNSLAEACEIIYRLEDRGFVRVR